MADDIMHQAGYIEIEPMLAIDLATQHQKKLREMLADERRQHIEMACRPADERWFFGLFGKVRTRTPEEGAEYVERCDMDWHIRERFLKKRIDAMEDVKRAAELAARQGLARMMVSLHVAVRLQQYQRIAPNHETQPEPDA